MKQEEFIAFYSQGLVDYAQFWELGNPGDGSAMSKQEAAYHYLECLGMLFRYSGNKEVVGEFMCHPHEERVALVEAACEHVLECAWRERAETILREEFLDEDSQEQLENLLTQRDALEVTLSACRTASSDFDVDEGGRWRSLLAKAIVREDEFDQALFARPDALMNAVDALAQVRNEVAIPINLSRQWWFSEPHMIAEAAEAEFTELLDTYALLSASQSTDMEPSFLERVSALLATVSSTFQNVRNAGQSHFEELMETLRGEGAVLDHGSLGVEFAAAEDSPKPVPPVRASIVGYSGVFVVLMIVSENKSLRLSFFPESDTRAVNELEGGHVLLFEKEREIARVPISNRMATVQVGSFTPSGCIIVDKHGNSVGELGPYSKSS